MEELKTVTLERAVMIQVKEMMAKWELKRARQIRASALGDEITQLKRSRSLWPPIMSELESKFAYKKGCKKVLVKEEDWTAQCHSNALIQEGQVTDDDNDDNDDDDDGAGAAASVAAAAAAAAAAAPAPIQRPPLQMRRRRGRHGEPLYINIAPC